MHAPAATLGPTTPPSLLIAEDKIHALQSLDDWVRHAYPLCRVCHAATAADARRLALAERPTVVLVDIDMHDALGFEILRVLRTELPDAHLIALSMFHAEAWRDYAAGAGAKACLSLATSDSQLKDTIEALLTPPRHPTDRPGAREIETD
jgi:DNA-binding NarL/FixJ family response regulator